MDILRDCVEDRTKQIIKAREEVKNLPVYKYPGAYAHEHGELEQYRASRSANIACKEAIDQALAQRPASFDELLTLLQQAGIEVPRRRKSLSLKAPGWRRPSRISPSIS